MTELKRGKQGPDAWWFHRRHCRLQRICLRLSSLLQPATEWCPFGKFAINAPYDAQGYNTYMGAKMVHRWLETSTNALSSATLRPSTTLPQLPAMALRQGLQVLQHLLLTAKMANGQIVLKVNTALALHRSLAYQYATNGGQWRGQDQYTVDYASATQRLMLVLILLSEMPRCHLPSRCGYQVEQVAALLLFGPWLYPRRNSFTTTFTTRICRHCFYHDNHLCCART